MVNTHHACDRHSADPTRIPPDVRATVFVSAAWASSNGILDNLPATTTPAVIAAFVIAVVLYLPFASPLYQIPGSSFDGPLIEIAPRFTPSFFALVLGLAVLILPLLLSIFLLSRLALAREQPDRKYKRVFSKLGKHLLIPISVAAAAAGFSMPAQAGLFISIAALLFGSWLVSVNAGTTLEWAARMLTRWFGVTSDLAVLRSVAFNSKEKVSGYIQLVTWVALLPAAIFTASAIQTRAEGEGGIAQWDFWVLFATPLILLFLGFVCLFLVFGEVLSPVVRIYVPQGTPTYSGYLGRILYFMLTAAFGLIVSITGSLITWILMSLVWNQNLFGTLSLVAWGSIGQVALICAVCGLAALGLLRLKQQREDARKVKTLADSLVR